MNDKRDAETDLLLDIQKIIGAERLTVAVADTERGDDDGK